MKKDASYVARGAVKATLNRKRKYIPGGVNNIIMRLLKTLPTSWVLLLSGKLSGSRYSE
jgi:short-subunit dehydrogenase